MLRLFLFISIFFGFSCFAQEDYSARSGLRDDIPTIATQSPRDGEKFDKTKTANFPVKLEYLLTRNPSKVLYGNPCAEEVAYSHGFKYVIVPKTMADGYSNEGIFWHNWKTNFRLFFKNGPFFKHRVRKGIRACKVASGDFVY